MTPRFVARQLAHLTGLLGLVIPLLTNRRIVARQLAHPTGLLGRVMALLMNRRNAQMNALAVRQLTLSGTDRVLEIGFGGGPILQTLLANAAFVAGVDRSPDMVARAKAHHARAVDEGRAEFRAGEVEAIPFEAESFDKICTLNTVYFWRSLDEGAGEIARVLVPGGRAVIGFLPKMHMDRLGVPLDIFTPRTPDEVIAALTRAGFREVRAEQPSSWKVIMLMAAKAEAKETGAASRLV